VFYVPDSPPTQYTGSTGYMGDDFYRSKYPTSSIKVLKEEATKENLEQLNNKTNKYKIVC